MTATIHPLLFQGTLLNRHGDAVEDARIQLWQTDLDGNYLHPLPGAAGSPKDPVHASIVDDFQYFGTDATDSNGNFEFLTYRPGIYPDRPYSHFHFMVWLGGEPAIGDADGEYPPPALVTQFYFDGGAPPNSPGVLELDVTDVNAGVYDYGSYVNGTIVVDDGSSSMATGGGALLPTSPTQPKGPFYPEIDFFSMDNDLTTADSSSPTKEPALNPVTASPTKPTSPEIPVNDDMENSTASKPVTGSPTKQPTQKPDTDSPVVKPAASTAPTLLPVQSASSSSAAVPSLLPLSWFLCGLVGGILCTPLQLHF